MRIGIDFDNTIVCYDAAFYEAAVEQELIPASCGRTKLAVRSHLRNAGEEDIWTELQGFVYGKCMRRVGAFDGLVQALKLLSGLGNELFIISHKTRYPYKGPKYDLHESARAWVNENLIETNCGILKSAVFFEETKELKLQRIEEQDCDVFIDDLPEILLNKQFPEGTRRVLFDSDNILEDHEHYVRTCSWGEFAQSLESVSVPD